MNNVNKWEEAYVKGISADVGSNRYIAILSGGHAEVGRDYPVQLYDRVAWFRTHPRLFGVLLNVFDYCFSWWFIYLIIAVRFVSSARIWFGRKASVPCQQRVLVDTLGRYLPNICKNICFQGLVILRTKRKFGKLPERYGKTVDLDDIIGFKTCWHAFVFAVRVVSLTRKVVGVQNILHSLKAFDWYLVKLSVDMFKPMRELLFCNENDRWFFLFESFNDCRRTMLQHGVLPSREVVEHPLMTSCRETHIDTVYCFNEQQAELFGLMIRHIGLFKYFTPRIELQTVDSTQMTVLLIGNSSMFADREESLIRGIMTSGIQIKMFVKPHPAHSVGVYMRLKREYSFTLIDDQYFYPLCDVVLSYKSSLAEEYKLRGVDVVDFTEIGTAGAIDVLAKARRQKQ